MSQGLKKWLLGTILLGVAAILLSYLFGDCHQHDVKGEDVTPATAKPVDVALTEWQSNLKALQSDTGLVGVASVRLDAGEISNIATAGTKQVGRDLPIAEDEVWHIGSITKSMTASMIARLVERGDLKWETTIAEVFGSDGPHADWQNVTLEQLLSHTSGAPANFSAMSSQVWPDSEAALSKARREWVEAIIKVKPDVTPGTEFRYSNVGYTIAGTMASITTGKSWETLMQREVFGPLGLDSAGFGAPSSASGKAVAWGHAGGKAYDPAERADNTPIIGPAGIVHMTLQDLASFGYEHVKGINGASDYLSSESFQKLHEAKLDNYALGWVEIGERKWAKGPITYHNGSNTFWYALLVLLPEQDKVYAMAANDGNVAVAEKAFFDFLVEDNKKSLETE